MVTLGLFCRMFGHAPADVNAQELTARCDRCGKMLWVSHDAAGRTVVTGEQPKGEEHGQ